MVNVSYNIPSSILRLFSYYPSLDTIHLPGPNLRFRSRSLLTCISIEIFLLCGDVSHRSKFVFAVWWCFSSFTTFFALWWCFSSFKICFAVVVFLIVQICFCCVVVFLTVQKMFSCVVVFLIVQ